MIKISSVINLFRIFSIAWFAAVVGLSVAKNFGLARAELRQLEHLAGGDTVLHIWLAGVMAFLFLMAAPANWLRGYLYRVINPVTVILIFGCLLDELLQQYIPTRHFSWLDFLASVFGLIIGSGTALLLRFCR